MKIENALAAKAPSQEKSARIITAAFGQQAKHSNEK
jgi:hypothetical protein